MNLIPYSRYARTVLNCEKRPFLREFLDEPDTPSWHSSGPPPGGNSSPIDLEVFVYLSGIFIDSRYIFGAIYVCHTKD